MTERDFQQQIIDYARLRGWKVHHDLPSQRANGRWSTHTQGDQGFPDLVLVRGERPARIVSGIIVPRPPRIVFAELKTQNGKVRPEQQEWLDTIGEDAEVTKWVWRPKDFDLARTVLE